MMRRALRMPSLHLPRRRRPVRRGATRAGRLRSPGADNGGPWFAWPRSRRRHSNRYRRDRPSATAMRSTQASTSAFTSRSHRRTTDHPAPVKSPVVDRSRARLASIFFRHHAAFAFGQVPWSGHPCQKHRSTSTASRAATDTMSAFRRVPGIAQWRRNRRPGGRFCETLTAARAPAPCPGFAAI